MPSVLKIKDGSGNFIPITAIRGENGKSAYEQAKEGGYYGTEAEFIALLNGLTNSEDAAHYSDLNNPHKVTAQQTGAIPESYYTSADLNTELRAGGGKMTVCCYNGDTANTPYKSGLTTCTHGMVITNTLEPNYGTQLCVPSGDYLMYIRSLSGGNFSNWYEIYNSSYLDEELTQMKLEAGDAYAMATGASYDVNEWIAPRVDELENKKVSIATGTYKGTGSCGSKNPNTLTFDFVPKCVIVAKRGASNAIGGGVFIWISPNTTLNFINNGSTYWCNPSLNGTTISWYNAESASYQLNASTSDYDYLAWG